MNRQIKFRGKRIDNGEWVYGDYTDGYIVNYIDLATSWEPNTSDHKLTVRAYEVDPNTVGQLVIKQYKGTDIYEHDIVNDGIHQMCIVIWSERDAKFQLGIIYTDEFDGEGIRQTHKDFPLDALFIKPLGNKFDNPELLTQ